MRFAIVARSAASLGLIAWSCATRADEEKIPLKDVPRAVLDAVRARFPGAELSGAEKETEDGETTYEVALKVGGRNVDVALTAQGKIVEIEREVAPKDLPGAVSAAIESKYPKSTIKKAEEVVEFEADEEEKSFEAVVVTAEKKTLEVKVSPQGKILKDEEEYED